MLKSIPRELGFVERSLRKLSIAQNQLEIVPGEFCLFVDSIDLDLSKNPLKVCVFENK